MIHSTLRHYRLTTSNLPAMVDWYARIFGMVPNRRSAMRSGAQTDKGLIAAWGTNSNPNSRLTVLAICRLAVERQQKHQHITFDCATIDDLKAAYVRLKNQGIEPVHAVYGVGTTAFYYDDPDHNRVELTVNHSAA